MRMLLVGVLAAALATIGTGLANFGDKPQQTYATATVKRGSISSSINATGVVNPAVMVDIGSQLSGQISEVLVNFNDSVKAGQVIARLDPEAYVAIVDGAKADLKIAMAAAQQQKAALQRAKVAAENARTARSVAEAELAAARAKQDEAERDVQRNSALAKTAAISDREFTQSRAARDAGAANLRASEAQLTMKAEAIEIADAEVAMAQANLESAQAVVEQKKALLAQAEVNLQYTEIRAPIDGIVIKRAINPGQTVAVSLESKTLFKITDDLREMEVHGRIDEADVGRIKVGQLATFMVDAYPERVFSGRVLQVRKSPEISQSVVTYTAVISAPNPDHLLFPGMTARLHIVVEQADGVLLVPNAALRFRPDGVSDPDSGAASGSAAVFVAGSRGEAQRVPVTLGKSDEAATELTSGALNEGDAVIVGSAQ
jgi:HlyD family secretion protein